MNNFFVASILTAFDSETIGTKVVEQERFFRGLTAAVEGVNFEGQRTPGQAFVAMSEEFFSSVSGGDARHTNNADDYVVRCYRGSVGLYLKREHAAPLQSLAAIVYTREAYLADPEVVGEEAERLKASDAPYVLVAVLASGGPKPALGYERFVKNLAGGNRDFLPESTTVEELAQKAKDSVLYNEEWGRVAD